MKQILARLSVPSRRTGKASTPSSTGSAEWRRRRPAEARAVSPSFSSSTDASTSSIPTYIDTRLSSGSRPRTRKSSSRRVKTAVGAPGERLRLRDRPDRHQLQPFALVADGLMDGPVSTVSINPWLKSKKAVVGFCGATSRRRIPHDGPARRATIRSRDGLVQKTSSNSAWRATTGNSSGGWLDHRHAELPSPQ